MKFYDIAKIKVISGAGGNGIVSARREKHLPYGGPAGGDGGRGGSIIFVSSEDENTLLKYRYKKEYKARRGEDGKSSDKNGSDAENMLLKVPVGTVIKNIKTGKVLFQFEKHGQEYIVAKGGCGGWGNKHFTTSKRQFPEFALFGEPGEILELGLEVQLLGDIALIGFPSVGKSTIINSISNAKAKVAEYHFTTLIPNLGIVKFKDSSYTVVDVPGLIKGASDGKGLGNQFLRHILKAEIFAFIFDISRYETGMEEFSQLWDEIIGYINTRFIGSVEYGNEITKVKFKLENEGKDITLSVFGVCGKEEILILKKVLIFVFNKSDSINDEEILGEYQKEFTKIIQNNLKKYGKLKLDEIKSSSLVISAAGNLGLDRFKEIVGEKVERFKGVGLNLFEKVMKDPKEQDYIKDTTAIDMSYLVENGFLSESDGKFAKIWEVFNRDFAYWAYILPWGNDDAELRFWDKMSREGFLKQFQRAGVMKGDILKIKSIYNGVDDRYIMRDM
ncbi:MAG: Obg family GTPase CgtA [Candidatus Absconditabacteria bacterium]